MRSLYFKHIVKQIKKTWQTIFSYVGHIYIGLRLCITFLRFPRYYFFDKNLFFESKEDAFQHFIFEYNQLRGTQTMDTYKVS